MPDSPVAAESCSNLPAIVTAHGRLSFGELSFGELDSASARAEQRLRGSGVMRGDIVGVALGQTVEAVVMLRGLMRIGAAACMIDPRWPQNEIDRAMSAAGCIRLIDRFTIEEADAEVKPPNIDQSQPATIFFTSGSTGEPKLALHSVDNHVQSALASNANMPLAPGDRWLLSLPLHHVAGIAILFRCACAGAAVAVPDVEMPLARAIEALRP
ncbi:MAG: class I adenylate-forming enzyme family protein, partial [Candidatus Hydrogenedentes bacterium]|nr:class I adenylate-forming enzyme family protein [Candidatus Hydrogenedentota bacterium]